MISEEVKNQVLSRVDIRSILEDFGIPYKESYGRVIFSLREEKNPSCSAVFDGDCWRWRDFGDPLLRGTVIHLYSYLKYGECSFSWEVVKEIAEKYLNSSPVKENSPSLLPVNSQCSGAVKVIAVLDDFLNAQREYLKSRGVHPLPQSSPVYPVLYEYRGKRWYGLGIKTLSGGWVIRQTLKNEKFARYLFSGKADISFWKGMNKKLVVVEGMFDALSLRVLRRSKGEVDNIVVLIRLLFIIVFFPGFRGNILKRLFWLLTTMRLGEISQRNCVVLLDRNIQLGC